MAALVWNGTADWTTTSDWGGLVLPGAVDTAEIASGTADVSSSDPLQDVSSLTVDAGAAVTVEGGLTVGDSHLSGVPNILAIAGSLQVDGGGLTIGQYVTSATGTITLSSAGSLQWNADGNGLGAISTGLTLDMGANAGNTSFSFSQAFNGQIDNFNGSDIISYSGVVTNITIGANSATFTTATNSYTINFGSGVNTADITVSGNSIITSQAVCFASGTRIHTVRGEVAVEKLAVGDLAVTGSGEARPIVWLGSRRVIAPPHDAWPVRVMAGAFGDKLPARDLFLSPGHAVAVNVLDEVFVPVGDLINGATIARVAVPEVTYWHVELESHDVLLADGLGCESYMDAGNRAWFAGGEGGPDPVLEAESLAAYGRPFINQGPVVNAIRQRLAMRAESLGWTRAGDPDLHLMVDGQRLEVVLDEGRARFAFAAAARDVRLMCRVFVPSADGRSQDRRELGVQLRGLEVCGQVVPLDDPALDARLYDLEQHGETAWRWTRGETRLSPTLWSGREGAVDLALAFRAGTDRRWRAPAPPAKPRRLRVVA